MLACETQENKIKKFKTFVFLFTFDLCASSVFAL